MKLLGLIDWQFTPLSDLTLSSPELEDEVYFERLMSIGGVKTQKLFPYLLSYFKQQTHQSEIVLRHDYDKTRFAVNGAKVFVGNPMVPIKLLDEITTSELTVLPHISSRGPNGIWTIRRGANHPLTLAVEKMSAYCYLDEQIKPMILILSNNGIRPNWTCARVVELFSSVDEAKVYAENILEEDLDDSEIVQIKGQKLLDHISFADVVSIDGDEYAISSVGSSMLIEKDIVSTADLMELLKVFNR